jgi:LacI family transcriptional regulator
MGDRVTVRDVAKAADVSASTVSRALSDSDLVAPETRRYIRGIADRLGYATRAAAPEAPTRGRQVAIVVPDIDHPSYSSLIKGASQQALRERYTVTVADSDGDPAVERANALTLSSVATGLILSSSRIRDEEIRELAADLPVVLVNRSVEGVPSVFYDSTVPIRRALEHLYAFGHRQIAYAGGPEHSRADQDRWRAITTVAPTLPGLEVTRIGHFEPDLGEGRSAGDLLIATRATAVLSYNDFIAVQIIARLRMRGLSVPEDMSVVGIDDSLTASVSQPALTTVKTPLREIGRTAVNLVLDQVAPLPSPRPPITMPIALVVRDSTAAPRRDRG